MKLPGAGWSGAFFRVSRRATAAAGRRPHDSVRRRRRRGGGRRKPVHRRHSAGAAGASAASATDARFSLHKFEEMRLAFSRREINLQSKFEHEFHSFISIFNILIVKNN